MKFLIVVFGVELSLKLCDNDCAQCTHIHVLLESFSTQLEISNLYFEPTEIIEVLDDS